MSNSSMERFVLESQVRQVKEIFILADRLTAGPFEAEGFRANAVLERKRLAGLTDQEIDTAIEDPAKPNAEFPLCLTQLADAQRRSAAVVDGA